jgi:hypothetical protein
MDASTAALVGASAAAVVNLLAQLLAHRLALRRDRRNHRRQQLWEAVEAAAVALAVEERVSPADAEPGTFDEIAPEVMALARRAERADALLRVRFGNDHELVASFHHATMEGIQAAAKVSDALRRKKPTDERVLVEVAAAIGDAKDAVDRWVTGARPEVERLSRRPIQKAR